MAHLWSQNRSQPSTEWNARRLDGAEFDLSALAGRQPNIQAGATARLIRADAAGVKTWVIVAPADSGVQVNSRAIPAGLCVLADRDEIRAGGEVQYFSTETLAVVEPFPSLGRAVYCGRCRQKIEPGSPAVCCPACGVWYNQSADLPCWTYSEKCTFCGHPTALDTGFKWTPED
jgi:hypothetical protein